MTAAKMVAYNQQQRIAAAVKTIREVLGSSFDEHGGGFVTLAQAVKLYSLSGKRGYFRRDAKLRRSREYRAAKEMSA
jgi:hypothetical protein